MFEASSDENKEVSINFEEKIEQPRNIWSRSMIPKATTRKFSRITQVAPNEINKDVLKSNHEIIKGKHGEQEINYQGIVDFDRINSFQFYFPLGNVDRFIYKYNNISNKIRFRGSRRPEPKF